MPDANNLQCIQDLNYGELDKFFLLLAGLMSANLLVFVWIASNYVYKTVPHRQYHVTTSMSEGVSDMMVYQLLCPLDQK